VLVLIEGYNLPLIDIDAAPLSEQAATYRTNAICALLQSINTTSPIERETHRFAVEGWLLMAVQIDLILGV
jgi:hypothetical protein